MHTNSESRMTPRERLTCAVQHRQPDRPPIQVYLCPEIRQALEEHLRQRFGSADVLAALECDFRYFCNPYHTTTYTGPRPIRPAGCDSVDLWGTGYRQVRNAYGSHTEAIHFPLAEIETMDAVARYPWPKAELFDFTGTAEACRRAHPYVRVIGSSGVFDIVNGVGSRGRGMERVLCDISTHDEVGIAIIDRVVDYYYEYCRLAFAAAPGEIDMLHIGEDCGTQRGPLFSPQVFREFFMPRIQRFVNLAHANGAVCMLHSCGAARELYPLFIEMGVDIHDSAQPEPDGMEPAALKRDFGQSMSWCGMISTQRTLPQGTVEECREEAARMLRVMGAGGGYIFASGHNIQADVPLQNILAIYEVATGRNLR